MVNEIEESAIALILAAMTILTFINVVLRYGFQTGLSWGLEAVSFLFAWLVLFGASYAVKVTAHLGCGCCHQLVFAACAQGVGADCVSRFPILRDAIDEGRVGLLGAVRRF